MMKSNSFEKLERLSRRMRWMCYALALMTVAAMIYLCVVGFADPAQVFGMTGVDIRAETIGTGQKVAAMALNLVTAIILTLGFLSLGGMFSNFANGKIFESGPSTLMRRAGAAFLTAAIWGVIARSLTVVVLTFSNPSGARQLSIGFESMEMMGIVLAGLLFSIGHIHALASEMHAENREFV